MQITTPSELARAVKARRQALGLTQQEVAGTAGITRQSLARLENGSGGTSFDTVLRVLEPLGLTLNTSTHAQPTETGAARVLRGALEGIAAINTAALGGPVEAADWRKALADTLRKGRDAQKTADDRGTLRAVRVAALNEAIRAGDPDRADDSG